MTASPGTVGDARLANARFSEDTRLSILVRCVGRRTTVIEANLEGPIIRAENNPSNQRANTAELDW
jgi:hypothetical protein